MADATYLSTAPKNSQALKCLMRNPDRMILSQKLLYQVLGDLNLYLDQNAFFPWRRLDLDGELAEVIEGQLEERFQASFKGLISDYRKNNSEKNRLESIYGSIDWNESESQSSVVLVSAPGFSSTFSHGMISVGVQHDNFGSSGGTYIYRWDEGIWVKLIQVRSWMT